MTPRQLAFAEAVDLLRSRKAEAWSYDKNKKANKSVEEIAAWLEDELALRLRLEERMTKVAKTKETTYVVTGNVAEFWRIAHADFKIVKLNRSKAQFETKDKVFRLIATPVGLRGLRGVQVEFWGTSFQREDIAEIRDLVECARRA